MRMSVWKFENELVELRHAGNDEAARGNLRRIGREDEQGIGGGVVEHRGVGGDVAGIARHFHLDAAVGDVRQVTPLTLKNESSLICCDSYGLRL